VQVRGKTVYLQYSTRQEIVNATSSAEEPSNVLLATLENLQPDTVITIEQLWAVFAAFGSVQKIATFEKSAGFQALVQYENAAVAKAAKDQLDGRTIPRSILQSRTPCQLRIAFSGHRDLNVKYQSHRGRDFTNPDLPWAEIDPEVAAKGIQGAMSHSPEDGNVLLVQVRLAGPHIRRPKACSLAAVLDTTDAVLLQVDDYTYELTVDSIYEIFKGYGEVKKIAIFQKNNQWQALVQYPDHQVQAPPRDDTTHVPDGRRTSYRHSDSTAALCCWQSSVQAPPVPATHHRAQAEPSTQAFACSQQLQRSRC
jgi:polypyrimidine tract-binding protein 2